SLLGPEPWTLAPAVLTASHSTVSLCIEPLCAGFSRSRFFTCFATLLFPSSLKRARLTGGGKLSPPPLNDGRTRVNHWIRSYIIHGRQRPHPFNREHTPEHDTRTQRYRRDDRNTFGVDRPF